MSTKKIRRTSPPHEDYDLPRVDYPDESSTEGSIQKLLSQFGDGEIVAKVYELRPSGEECFLRVIPSPTPEKVSEESIRAGNHGRGGKFVLRFLVDGELRSTQQLLIADDPSAASVLSGNGTSDPTLQLLLQKITALEIQLANRQNPEREPINNLADAMLKLQQLQAPKQDTSLDTILKCIEIGKSLGGGGGSDWGSIIKDVVKEIGPTIAPLIMSAANGGVQRPGLPAGTNGGDSAMVEEQMLKQGIAFLKKKCMMRSDPGLYVDMVIDNAEEFPYSRLVHIATTQEFSAFTNLDPELGQEPYQTFFKTIYDGLRSNFGRTNSVDVDSGRTDGNENNPSGNGGADKAGSG